MIKTTNDDSEKIIKFFIDNGYIDGSLTIESLSLDLDVSDLPRIKVTYTPQENHYTPNTKEKSQ